MAGRATVRRSRLCVGLGRPFLVRKEQANGRVQPLSCIAMLFQHVPGRGRDYLYEEAVDGLLLERGIRNFFYPLSIAAIVHRVPCRVARGSGIRCRDPEPG